MLAGKMRHKDSAGHEGTIETGDIQWMRAAKGIIHSEMPEQEDGLLSGIQLWVNLPASHNLHGVTKDIVLDVTKLAREKTHGVASVAALKAKHALL